MNTYGLQVVPDPHQPADGPGRPGRPDLQDRAGQVRRRRRRPRRARTRRASRCWSARSAVEKSEYLASPAHASGASPTRCSTPSSTRGRRAIVAQAGRLGAVTVATNMAGRGVDILLGGNPEGLAREEVLKEGHAAETLVEEYNLPAPLDEHARGLPGGPRRGAGPLRRAAASSSATSARPRATRSASSAGSTCSAPSATRAAASTTSSAAASGRQGDPGESRFYLSLDDELMRLFATGAMQLGDGQGPARRRAHRGQDGHQGHRAGPEHRRAAQRRDPQERPQVRRGHERAAQGDLPRAATRSSPAPTCATEALEYLADAVDTTIEAHCVAEVPRGVGPRGPPGRAADVLPVDASPPSSSAECTQHRRHADARDGRGRGATTSAARRSSPPRSCARSSAR